MFLYLFSYYSVAVVVFLLQLQSDNRFGANDSYVLAG